MVYTLPRAVIKFRQGFGRLIRSGKDYGLVTILDTRVLTKAYGKVFLDSLPECNTIIASARELSEECHEFLRPLAQASWDS